MTDRSIDKKDWGAYFETLSGMLSGKRILIEVASPLIGDQIEANWTPLTGITYDHKDDLIDITVEGLDHMIRAPKSVYVHHDDKHIAAIEILDAEDQKHILKFKEPFFFGKFDI